MLTNIYSAFVKLVWDNKISTDNKKLIHLLPFFLQARYYVKYFA